MDLYGSLKDSVQRLFTFLIFLISKSSSLGSAVGLEWIFSLSLSNPEICKGHIQRMDQSFSLTHPTQSHLLTSQHVNKVTESKQNRGLSTLTTLKNNTDI